MRRPVLLVALVVAVTLGACSSSAGKADSSPSTKYTVPPLPAGWKTVSHNGFALDVPETWTVESWKSTCGVETPTVYFGPQGLSTSHCTTTSPGAEVDFGAFAYVGTLKQTVEKINGLQAYVVTDDVSVAGPPAGTMTQAWVRVIGPGALGFHFLIGDSTALPGGGPGMAQQIIDTIHVAS